MPRKLTVTTERRTQLVDITGQVHDAVEGGGDGSAVLVFVPHTTAGVTINEHADPAVARDFGRRSSASSATSGAGSTSRRARRTRRRTSARR